MASSLIILPALGFGAVFGLVEMLFVHSDEIGMGWFMHGLHAFPFTMLFTFINMNVTFVLSYIPFPIVQAWYVELIVRAIITVVAMLKIAGAAAIAGRVGVRFHHLAIIGILIFLAPYIWMFAGPFIPIPEIL